MQIVCERSNATNGHTTMRSAEISINTHGKKLIGQVNSTLSTSCGSKFISFASDAPPFFLFRGQLRIVIEINIVIPM